ncbi:hypothetical protein ACLG6S_17280 [Thermodesulfobacteriota bacterium B35]
MPGKQQMIRQGTRMFLAAGLGLLLLNGCGPSQGQRLVSEGASREYGQGYDDGCASGRKSAGDMFSQFHKNVRLYRQNADYRQGWDDGHDECRNEWLSNYRQQELGIERQRAYDEHEWLEKQKVRDAVPELTREQIDTLNKLGH